MKGLIHKITLLLILHFFCIEINAQCVDNGNYWIESWTSCDVSTSPNTSRGNTIWFLVEFDEPQAISSTQIWNANRVDESGSGANNVIIDISTNGTSWSQVGNETFAWPQGTELNDYEGFEGPDLSSYGFIDKILFTFLDNHEQSSCISIGELRFTINPEACYGQIDVCGVCNGPGIQTFYEDADNDGLGNPDSMIASCEAPAGYVTNADDNCDTGLVGWSTIDFLLVENNCTGCHNGLSGAGNLDLASYGGISEGGNRCGSSLLTGTVLVDIINISNYEGCTGTMSFPSMNERVGGALDEGELQIIQDWIDEGALYDCNCPDGSPDTDGDGICDASDQCNGFDDALIGSTCDDGDACTVEDIITTDCACQGRSAPDSDFDGVCDILDLSPNDPCTADGVIGMPEPANWFANESNDCDMDNVLVSQGDLNDYDVCISGQGSSLVPACACADNSLTGGGTFSKAFGVTNAIYAAGVPDGALSWGVGYKDYIELNFPYVEIGTEICVTLGFNDAEGRVQFEVNDLGIYKFINPNPELIDYEQQVVCFPTFVAGPQKVRLSRLATGTLRVDGSTYEYCPCSESDSKKELNACACPNDFTENPGVYQEAFGINDAEAADGLPDGSLTGTIAGTDSLILTYASQPVNYEICLDILFSDVAGSISLNVNGEESTLVNPEGLGAETALQKICFLTNSSESQTVIVKDNGPGSFKVDGSSFGYCNPCAADVDQDGICDDVDICLLGDDNLDEDGDGVPDACDSCNDNLVGAICDDGNTCTIGDVFDANCDCIGVFQDSDSDGICDANDLCPGFDDNIDDNNNGTPDGCDDCNLSLSIAADDISCPTNNNTFAVASVSGGTLPYTFNWSNGFMTSTISGLSAGTYTVTVEDASGCIAIQQITVIDLFSPMSISQVNIEPIVCEQSGVLDLVLSGGLAPYQFVNDGTIFDLPLEYSSEGNYNIRIIDANGCAIDTSLFLQDNSYQLEVQDPNTIVKCADENDLVIQVDNGDYQILWNTGSSTNELTNVSTGLYAYTITDELGCTGTSSIMVSDAEAIVIDLQVQNIINGQNGSAVATTNISNVTITWSNGQVGPNADNLAPGEYFVTVSDEYNCQEVSSFFVNCNGSSIGTACDDGDSCTTGDTYDANCDCIGTFQDADMDGVCDANDICPGFDDNIDINNNGNPDGCDDCDLSLSITAEDINCAGTNSSTAAASVTGGFIPYTYSWSNGLMTNTISNLNAGTYTLTVEDASGCLAIEQIEIIDLFSPLSMDQVNVDPIICDQNGLIDLMVSGGLPPYQFINDGAIIELPIDYSSEGIYNISVTDTNGCTVDTSLVLQDDSYPLEVNDPSTIIKCSDQANLEIQVDVGDYEILWSNGFTASELINVSEGLYSYTLTDEQGCTGMSSILVLNTEEIVIDLQIQNANNGQNGSAFASSNIPNAAISWSNGQVGSQANNLEPGEYSVTVTDEYGCQEVSTFLIEGDITSAASISTIRYFEISPNPASDFLKMSLAVNTVSSYDLEIVDVLGRTVWRASDDRSSAEIDVNLDKIDSGTYYCILKSKSSIEVRKLVIMK